jgi:hypothetical protein
MHGLPVPHIWSGLHQALCQRLHHGLGHTRRGGRVLPRDQPLAHGSVGLPRRNFADLGSGAQPQNIAIALNRIPQLLVVIAAHDGRGCHKTLRAMARRA